MKAAEAETKIPEAKAAEAETKIPEAKAVEAETKIPKMKTIAETLIPEIITSKPEMEIIQM